MSGPFRPWAQYAETTLHSAGLTDLSMQTPPTAMLPALATPDLAWPLNQSSDEEERLTVRLENMYERVCFEAFPMLCAV